MWLFKKKVAADPEPVKQEEKSEGMKVSLELLARLMVENQKKEIARPIETYSPPVGVIPAAVRSAVLAMDSTPYADINQAFGAVGFPGYPYLSQLALLPEYRNMIGIRSEEMTRKWIELKCVGEEDKTDRIKGIAEALDKYQVRDRFKEAAEHDGFFGSGRIYIDMRSPKGTLASLDPVELQSRLFLSSKKITKGSLVGFNVIEPIWTYPGVYNAADPLSADFYKPASWYVMGKEVHSSRLLSFVSRQVPDVLKAAYNFGGLSLSQMAEPYVNNWLRTRDSVSDLLHSFSTTGLKTNMSNALSGVVDEGFIARLLLFNLTKDNRGIFAINNTNDNPEELVQLNTPLSGLDKLQAQSQEHMCALSKTPLVKLTGITPSGLNASSEGEIQVWYDVIKAEQESIFRDTLKTVIDIIQLSEFGDIDTDITFDFISLEEMSDKEKAEIRKIDADTDAVLIGVDVISTNESRERLAADPDSPYQSLEIVEETDEEGDEETDEEGDEETENFEASAA
ncbi:phage-associated protein [Yersinia enterocolitica]|uniref:DUF1073 domain-containing protein n=1 Tax=Yersinia enterocolitica TaxID=630 RepID=UPI00065A8E7E|nr:DUF1073 domain-containing protein [Yersinia enterocolitica]CRY06202.1 phage-associated protein [Yersinia enterocolitica]